MHPSSRISGLNEADGTQRFLSFVWGAALDLGARQILDFGAGRGGGIVDACTAPSTARLKAYLQDLRNTGAEVTAYDVDPAVHEHPCSDRQVCGSPDDPMPFESDTFDLIVSDHTFEHIQSPDVVAAELLRVLRPNGYICARTPSKYGYVAVIATALPNSLHRSLISRIQPNRRSIDVFPTYYRLNTVADIRRYFPDCTILHYYNSAQPSYYFGSDFLYAAMSGLHRLLTGPLNTTLCVFIQKR